MMTGQCAPDVKCIALREPIIVAYVSDVYAAWTTIVLGMNSCLFCHYGFSALLILSWKCCDAASSIAVKLALKLGIIKGSVQYTNYLTVL